MKKCMGCGTHNSDDAKKCRNCGDPIPNNEKGGIVSAVEENKKNLPKPLRNLVETTKK